MELNLTLLQWPICEALLCQEDAHLHTRHAVTTSFPAGSITRSAANSSMPRIDSWPGSKAGRPRHRGLRIEGRVPEIVTGWYRDSGHTAPPHGRKKMAKEMISGTAKSTLRSANIHS
jgi:hypothetical protein